MAQSKGYRFRSNVPAARAALKTGLADGVAAAAEHVLDTSRPRVPDDTGRLQASGEVVVDRVALTATVAYGSTPDTAAYAVVQHERMDLRHDNGQAKYLESAMTGEASSLAPIVARETRRRT